MRMAVSSYQCIQHAAISVSRFNQPTNTRTNKHSYVFSCHENRKMKQLTNISSKREQPVCRVWWLYIIYMHVYNGMYMCFSFRQPQYNYRASYCNRTLGAQLNPNKDVTAEKKHFQIKSMLQRGQQIFLRLFFCIISNI